MIVCNPPYIKNDDPLLEKNVAHYEPTQALISEDNGLKDLQTVIADAKHYLHADGHLIVEHGFQQKKDVQELFNKNNYHQITTHKDLPGKYRVTSGLINY